MRYAQVQFGNYPKHYIYKINPAEAELWDGVLVVVEARELLKVGRFVSYAEEPSYVCKWLLGRTSHEEGTIIKQKNKWYDLWNEIRNELNRPEGKPTFEWPGRTRNGIRFRTEQTGDMFEKGEWYMYFGPPVERPPRWSSDGSMDYMLDREPRICIEGSYRSEKFPFTGSFRVGETPRAWGPFMRRVIFNEEDQQGFEEGIFLPEEEEHEGRDLFNEEICVRGSYAMELKRSVVDALSVLKCIEEKELPNEKD